MVVSAYKWNGKLQAQSLYQVFCYLCVCYQRALLYLLRYLRGLYAASDSLQRLSSLVIYKFCKLQPFSRQRVNNRVYLVILKLRCDFISAAGMEKKTAPEKYYGPACSRNIFQAEMQATSSIAVAGGTCERGPNMILYIGI